MAENNHLIIAIVAIVAIVGIVGMITGNGSITSATTTVTAVSKGGATVVVPPHAVEVAPGLFDLGEVVVDGEVAQGFMFIDYRRGFEHKPKHKPRGQKGGGKCFAFLAKGARWKVTEPYVLNPANADGMSDAFVTSRISTGLETWDGEVAFDVFGPGTTTTDTLVADTESPDGSNEIFFADIDSPGAIAVAIVWGVFGGPPQNRRLIEWDVVFDDVDFDFGDAGPTSETSLGDTSLMDLQNIATHEGGHTAGMGHPDDGCTEETMYRFASFGETKKRTLNAGDIAGITELYK